MHAPCPASRFLVAMACLLPLALAISGAIVPPCTARAQSTSSGHNASVLRALGQLPHRQGAQALVAALDGGLPDALVPVALVALGQQGGQLAADTLTAYTQHRRAAVRVVAYEALAAALGPQAAAHLANGLADTDDRVRELCATLLGEYGAAEATAALQPALARGVSQAAPSIAALAPPADLTQLRQMVAAQPIAVQLQAYRVALERPDITVAQKQAFVTEVLELGTASARSFLVDLLKSPVGQQSAPLRQALLSAIRRIAPGGGGVQ